MASRINATNTAKMALRATISHWARETIGLATFVRLWKTPRWTQLPLVLSVPVLMGCGSPSKSNTTVEERAVPEPEKEALSGRMNAAVSGRESG